MEVVQKEAHRHLVFVLYGCRNDGRVQVLQELVAESHISVKVLVGLEDSDHIVLSKLIYVLLEMSD